MNLFYGVPKQVYVPLLILSIALRLVAGQQAGPPPPGSKPPVTEDYYYTDDTDDHDKGALEDGRARKPLLYGSGFRLDSTEDTPTFVVPVRVNIECFEENCQNFALWSSDPGAAFDDVADPSPNEAGVQRLDEVDYVVLRQPGTYLVKASAIAPGFRLSTVTTFKIVVKDESNAFEVPDISESLGKLEKPELYVDDGSVGYELKALNRDAAAPPYLLPVEVFASCEEGGQLVLITNDAPLQGDCQVPLNMPLNPIEEIPNRDNLKASGYAMRFVDCGDSLDIHREGCYVVRMQAYKTGYTPSDPETVYIKLKDIELDFDAPNALDAIRPAADSGLLYVWVEFKFEVLMDPITEDLDYYKFKGAVHKVVKDFVSNLDRQNIQVRGYSETSVKFQVEVDEADAGALYQVVDHPFSKYPFSQSLYREGLLNATSECTAYDALEVAVLARLDKLSTAGLSSGIVAAITLVAVAIMVTVTMYSRYRLNQINKANKVLAENKAVLDKQEKVLEEDKKELEKREDDLEEMEKDMQKKMAELDKREKELEAKIKEFEEEEKRLQDERSNLKEEQESVEKESNEAQQAIERMENKELLEADPDLAKNVIATVEEIDVEVNAQFEQELEELKRIKEEGNKENKPPLSQEEYDNALHLLNMKKEAKKRLATERVQQRRRYLLTQVKHDDQLLLAAADEPRAKELINELEEKEILLQKELLDTIKETKELESVMKLEEEFEMKHATIVKEFETKRSAAVAAAKVAFDLDDISESDLDSPRPSSSSEDVQGEEISKKDVQNLKNKALEEEQEAKELNEKLEKLKKEAPSHEQFLLAEKDLNREIEKKKKDQRAKLEARRRVLALKKQKESKTKEEEEAERIKQEEIRKAQEQANSAKRKVASIFHKLLNNENKVQNLKEQYNSAQLQLEENVKKEKEKQRQKLLARRKAAAQSTG